MDPGLMIPLVVAMLAGGAFLVNEWSEGALAEGMGLGQHHMLDHRRHCNDGQPPMHTDVTPMHIAGDRDCLPRT